MRVHWSTMLLVTLQALAAPAADFEFVVIGDTRPKFESMSFQPFERLISNINALKPALVVNLGDLIYGYGPFSKERQWDKYESVIKEFRVPYYQTPGNHDTHSQAARRIYGRRFGRFFQSFDHGDCHFVLLDNTENERWGYLGPAQLDWLKQDLQQSQARSVFVFLHFPVWEAERIKLEYHEFWLKTLHPLFKAARVRAVFGGHYHTYGPTREFDGIRYFITGGGGAELIPEYRTAGGVHHFMRVKVSGDRFDVRVVTEQGELADPEADVMGGLQFATRNVSRIGIKRDAQALRAGVPLTVSVNNPYPAAMAGQATWLLDASTFSIQPASVTLDIPAGATRPYDFTLKALRDTTTLQSLPQLEFNVVSGGTRHRFHREVRLLQATRTAYRTNSLTLDGRLVDWEGIPPLRLGGGDKPEAELRSCFDAQDLYLAVTVPKCDDEEAKEIGFSDALQIGLARALDASEFGGDQLRLGFSVDTPEAKDRTPGRKGESILPGTRSVARTEGEGITFELRLPLRLLKGLKLGEGARLVLDLSFPLAANDGEPAAKPEPAVNTFAYSVRFGSDSLVPVYYVELDFDRKR